MSEQFPTVNEFSPRADLPWLLVVDGGGITVEACDIDECLCQELPRSIHERTIQEFATYDAAHARGVVLKAYGVFDLNVSSLLDPDRDPFQVLAETLQHWDDCVYIVHAEDWIP